MLYRPQSACDFRKCCFISFLIEILELWCLLPLRHLMTSIKRFQGFRDWAWTLGLGRWIAEDSWSKPDPHFDYSYSVSPTNSHTRSVTSATLALREQRRRFTKQGWGCFGVVFFGRSPVLGKAATSLTRLLKRRVCLPWPKTGLLPTSLKTFAIDCVPGEA